MREIMLEAESDRERESDGEKYMVRDNKRERERDRETEKVRDVEFSGTGRVSSKNIHRFVTLIITAAK